MSATGEAGLSNLGGSSNKLFQIEGASSASNISTQLGFPARSSARFPQWASSFSNLLFLRMPFLKSEDVMHVWSQPYRMEASSYVFNILLQVGEACKTT